MIALVKSGRNVELREMPPPAVRAPADVLVAVKSAGVCTSDLAIVSGAFGDPPLRILGHEIAGQVAAVGSAVRRCKAGDRVALQPTIYCGACPCCQRGDWHLCPRRKFVGLDVDGGFAEQMVVPEANLVPVPASVPYRQACLVEPLACVVHAIDCFGVLPERGIVITGAGVSAFLFVQVLIALGMPRKRILVSGRRARRLAIVRDLGVPVVDVRSEALAERAAAIFGEAGPDMLGDQTGDPALLRAAMDLIARKGTLFIYDFMGREIPFHFGVMQLREITIKTSTGCPETLPRALDLMAGQVDVAPAITHVFRPSQMKEAFESLTARDDSHVKSVIEFG